MEQFDFQKTLNEFELQAAEDDQAAARKTLRKLLFGLAGEPLEGSIPEVVAHLSRLQQPPLGAAPIMLRAIAWDGFLTPNTLDSLPRYIVPLIEKSLPGLCNFLGLQEKRQAFEKYEILAGVKNWVDGQLNPLCISHSTLDSLLNTRASIKGSLAHGRLKEFGRIYKISEVANAVDTVFLSLKKVSKIADSLADDVEICENTISEALSLVESNPSFVTLQYLKPFLQCASQQLQKFIDTHRGQFSAVVKEGWSGNTLPKRYPLLDSERILRILVPFRSDGRGAATDVKVKAFTDSSELLIANEDISLGSISPGKFSISIDVEIYDPCEKFEAILQVEWGEVGTTKRQEANFDICVLAQASGIKWNEYTYADPYGTGPAEGDDFVGRHEQIQTLVTRMLRRPMEPSYITGQKRVGKTSLATVAAEQAHERDPKRKLSWHYILWGQIAHEDPRVSLQQLGEEIESFVFSKLPSHINASKGEYKGSLSPLVKLSNIAKDIDADHRFLVVIDEFDEMPQELYLQGNLADTVFGNIRALTASHNICLLLVGGENMPFVMDRQGQKLNKFSRVNLTYFNRGSEWDDYVRLIREPTKDLLNWHDDAIAEIYDLTNGNPYFSNIICSKVYERVLNERDLDITREEVLEVVRIEISHFDENLFAHLWQDGIFAPADEREPIVLMRKRILAALARCIRKELPCNITNIYEQCSWTQQTAADLTSLLADFVNREVLVERDGQYRAVLPIFELWLADIGVTRLAADALSERLATNALQQEDEARVLSRELVELTEKWPTYRGKHVSSEDVRAWLEQRASNREQRILFNILKSIRFLSEAEILDRIRTARLTVLKMIEAVVRKKESERRNDVVITYVDGEGKSGQKYAGMYAEENLVNAKSILSPSSFENAYKEHTEQYGPAKVIVVIDDLVGTGRSLATNMKNFHDENSATLNGDRPLLLVFSLLATKEGQQHILRELSKLEYSNVDFRAGEILDESASLLGGSEGIFATETERDQAKALAVDIGATIYKKAPLGYGGQSLGIVFPTTVPNNCLPLLHSRSKGHGPQWRPLFERMVN